MLQQHARRILSTDVPHTQSLVLGRSVASLSLGSSHQIDQLEFWNGGVSAVVDDLSVVEVFYMASKILGFNHGNNVVMCTNVLSCYLCVNLCERGSTELSECCLHS